MSIQITLKTTSKKLTVQIPHIEFNAEKRNLMAVDPSNNMVVDIGRNQSEFKAEFPKIWEKNHKAIRFIDPFDFNANGIDSAIALIWHYAQVARKKKGSIILPRKSTPIELDLWLEDYETQPEALRQKFEYILVKDKRLDIKKLSINGATAAIETQFEAVKQRNKQQMKVEWTLWLAIFLWFGLLMFSGNIVWSSLGLSVGVPMLDLAVFAIIFVLLLSVSVVFGTTTWAMVAKNYLPYDTIIKFFPRQKILKSAVNSLLTQFGVFDAR